MFEYLDDDELRGKLDELKAALTEARKAQDDFAASSVKSKEAATDNSSAVAKEAESVTKYTKAVIDADKHIKEFNSRHEKANKEFEQGHKILDDMVEKSEDYVRQLEFEVSLIGKTEREQAILTAERKLGAGATQELKDRTREYTGELFDNKEAMKAAAAETKRVGEAAKEMEQVWADSRSVLSDFFFEFAADGKDAFDTLVEGFKAMIAKMIAEAAANQIILGIGAVAGGLGFSGAANAASLAGGVVLATSETWRHLHMGYFHRAAAYLPIRACSSHRPVMVGRRWAPASTGQMPGSAWPAGLQVGSLPTRCLAGPAA